MIFLTGLKVPFTPLRLIKIRLVYYFRCKIFVIRFRHPSHDSTLDLKLFG